MTTGSGQEACQGLAGYIAALGPSRLCYAACCTSAAPTLRDATLSHAPAMAFSQTGEQAGFKWLLHSAGSKPWVSTFASSAGVGWGRAWRSEAEILRAPLLAGRGGMLGQQGAHTMLCWRGKSPAQESMEMVPFGAAATHPMPMAGSMPWRHILAVHSMQDRVV